MDAKFYTPVMAWGVLAATVLLLAAYRWLVARQEDDKIHLHPHELGINAMQEHIAHKLEVLDRWGKILTVIAFVYGLGIVAWVLYEGFLAGANLHR